MGLRTYFRLNENIRAERVRLIDGKENPILPLGEALNRARQQGLSLVEVSDKAEPPVVKIVDFKKFLYEQKRKIQTVRAKKSSLKELRLSPNIGENDLGLRIRRAQQFLKEGHQVKLTVVFRGREVTHWEIGQEKLNRFVSSLEKEGHQEGQFRKLGRFLSALIVPHG
jgi:translation initiation factor IF-3